MVYLFKIGKQEYNCYDETVNGLADLCDGILSKDQLEYAIQQLNRSITENTWNYSIDVFCLILHFCDEQGVDCARVVDKLPDKF